MIPEDYTKPVFVEKFKRLINFKTNRTLLKAYCVDEPQSCPFPYCIASLEMLFSLCKMDAFVTNLCSIEQIVNFTVELCRFNL